MTGDGLPVEPGAMPHCAFANDTEFKGVAVARSYKSGKCISFGQVAPEKQTWVLEDTQAGGQAISITFSGGAHSRQVRLLVQCDPAAATSTFTAVQQNNDADGTLLTITTK